MTAATGYFTTIDQVKTFLSVSGTAADATINALLPGITAGIETLCKRTFQQESFTEYFDGNGRTGAIFVKNPPITGVVDLRQDGNREWGSTSLYSATNDYVVYADRGQIKLVVTKDSVKTTDGALFERGVQNVRAVYTGGWTPTDCPSDVKNAATIWAAHLYNKITQRRYGAAQTSEGNRQETVRDDKVFRGVNQMFSIHMPKEAYLLLEPWILRNVG